MGKASAHFVSTPCFSSPATSNLRLVCHYFFIHVIISFSSSSQFSKSLKILQIFPPVPFWILISFRFCPSISCNSEPSIFHLHTDSKPPTTLLRCCEDHFNLNKFPLNIPKFFDSKSYISKRWYRDTLKTN